MREEIHHDVCERGFDAKKGVFMQAYDSEALDACALLIPNVGFLPYDGEHGLSTIETMGSPATRDPFYCAASGWWKRCTGSAAYGRRRSSSSG